jgi:hypothetical protein
MLSPMDVISHLGKGELHWKIGRSAHAVATTWFRANGLPDRVATALRASDTLSELKIVDAFLERSVDLGDGLRPSQCDLLAVCSDDKGLAIAGVEAKVDESFGPFVSKWLDGSATKNKRLDILCAKLGLASADCMSLRYQLLHRTAATLIEAERYHANRAVLIIHSFCPNRTGLKDFTDFVIAMRMGDASPDTVVGPISRQSIDLFAIWISDTPPH